MSPYGLDDGACYVKDNVTQPFDERKSRIPYVKGWRFTVQQHNPPPPVELDLSILCTFEDKKESVKMEQLHSIERCLRYPPLPRSGSYGSSSLELQIHDTIRIGDYHNAQVVVVEVLAAEPPFDGLLQGQLVVAKLYDPMYIDDDDEFYVNPHLVADKDYIHETAAYMALPEFQGSVIPQYYGSYSLDIPLGPTEDKRSVRLILIELIPGFSIQKADPHQTSQKARRSIMKTLIEFDTLVYAKNILLRDVHPRNVMITNPDSQQTHICRC